MAVMKVEIMSRETIKPSIISRENLKPFKLSLLDQLAPSFYVPLVLFYSSDDNNVSDVVGRLKTSLAETLAQFYPLAGKIRDDTSLDVEVGENDGVPFVEARADCELSAVLGKPDDTTEFLKLLPIDDPYAGGDRSSGEGVPAVAVQASSFRCGGTALGICAHHRVLDGTTLSAFLSAWSHTSRSGGSVPHPPPRFDAADIFRPRALAEGPGNARTKTGRVVARRFAFGPLGLARLRARAGAGATRVEAVTALVSKAAFESRGGKKTLDSMAISHVVNLRPRMDPPLPENAVGNIWGSVTATVPGRAGLGHVAGRVGEEIRKLDGGGFAEKLRTEEGFAEFVEYQRKRARELARGGRVPLYRFSSWVRFSFYGSDFGFGAPVFVCALTVPIEGVVILMGNRSGDGIEAWVNLTENDMARFEINSELLEFASLSLPPRSRL